MAGRYNNNNSAVKRILQELKEFQQDNNFMYSANPLGDDLFEWHFSIRGQSNTEFEGGIYHGRIILPADYPFKPPNIVMLTPSGRFVVGEKICLSISGHHPEEWQPAWSIRTALVALISFMTTEAKGAIGSLDYPKCRRQQLAKESLKWECPRCGISPASSLSPPPQDYFTEFSLNPSVAIQKEKTEVSPENLVQDEDVQIQESKTKIEDNNNAAKVAQLQFKPITPPTVERIASLEATPSRSVPKDSRSPNTTQQRNSSSIRAIDLLVFLLISAIIALLLHKFLVT